MALLKKKKSRSLETAQFRANQLANIDETIDFGGGFNYQVYHDLVETAKSELDKYNSMMADVDEQRIVVRRLEKKLNDANERVFAGIITQYGRDSAEYEMMGGKRKSAIRNYRTETFDPDADEDDSVPIDDGSGTENP